MNSVQNKDFSERTEVLLWTEKKEISIRIQANTQTNQTPSVAEYLIL